MIVFTDLDGTLLDHSSYDYAPALPALQALSERETPVILASSKTAAEIAPLQTELKLDGWPAIVENGAGIHGLADAPGIQDDYDRLRQILAGLPQALRNRFTGFGDVTEAEVAEWTGLTPAQARLARRRAHTEPGKFDGDQAARAAFSEALAGHGVRVRQGGRFLTLTFGRTKADAMRELAESLGTGPVVALGDAPNDHDMLQAADIAIIIRNDHGPDPGPVPGAIRTRLEGPAGWNAAILDILKD